jgi:hypothetical protein
MANMKDMSVERGADLCEIVGKVRLGAKRADDGAVQAAQFLRLSDDGGESALFMVVNIVATRGAVSGETVLTLARIVGDGFSPVAMLSSRSPAPCNVARATDAEVIAAIALATGGSAVHLNPPAVRPTRAVAREGLRPVEFDCAPPVAGKCGTRGQRFVAEELETVAVLTASEGAGEWASAVDATPSAEPAATEPVMEASPEVASDEPAPSEPAATETEPSAEPAPVKGKRRKG